MPFLPKSGPKKLKLLERQSKALVARRAELGLTQKQAAAQFGTKVQTWLSWEHGRRAPRVDQRLLIVQAWELDPKSLSVGVDGKCPHCNRPY